jgi:hypothetical protein
MKRIMMLFIIIFSLIFSSGCLKVHDNRNNNQYKPDFIYRISFIQEEISEGHFIVPILYSEDLILKKYIVKPNNISRIEIIPIVGINITNYPYGLDVFFNSSFQLILKISGIDFNILPTLSLRKGDNDIEERWWFYYYGFENIKFSLVINAAYNDYNYEGILTNEIIKNGWNEIKIDYSASDD